MTGVCAGHTEKDVKSVQDTIDVVTIGSHAPHDAGEHMDSTGSCSVVDSGHDVVMRSNSSLSAALMVSSVSFYTRVSAQSHAAVRGWMR